MSRSSDRTILLGLSMKDWILVLVLVFPIIGTLFPLGSYMNSSGIDGAIEASSGRDTTVILALSLGYILWLLSLQPKKALMTLRRNALPFIFLLWAFVTASWSFNPALSFNRTGRMFVFALYAVYMIDYLPIEKARRILFIAMGVSCGISMVMIGAAPSLAKMVDARGAWRGAMMHKNNLGSHASMMFMFALLHWRLKQIDGRTAFLAVGVSAVLLFLSNNAGSLVSVIVILSLMSYIVEIACRTRNPLITLFLGSMIMVIVGVALSNSDFIFNLLGRDRTLTGREEVGDFAKMMIAERPIWGFGMGAWGEPGFQITVLQHLLWQAPHAHNSWLDFRLQLGIPGLIIAAIMWAQPSVNVLRLISRREIGAVAFPAAILMFLGFRSYSETILVDPGLTEMFWFVYAQAAFARAIAASDLPLSRRVRKRSARTFRFGGDVIPAG